MKKLPQHKTWRNERLPDDHPELSIKVYLGSGPIYHQIQNYINIDIQPYLGCIVWDFTRGLPFIENDSVDLVLSKLSFEFMPRDKVVPVLNEIHRILKPGGLFRFIGYDLEVYCRNLAFGKYSDNHEYFLRQIYGRQNFDEHGNKIEGTFRYTCYSFQILGYLLAKTGFVKIHKVFDPLKTKAKDKMVVQANKRNSAQDPVWLTTDGIPKDMLELKRKYRYHKGIK